jgi:hypothetical protein
MKNPALKERHSGNPQHPGVIETPYMTWRSGDWTWHVLKSWQAKNGKPGARWFCRVTTPFSVTDGDLGDVYVYDIVEAGHAELIDWDHDIWPDEAAVMAYVNDPQPPQPVVF